MFKTSVVVGNSNGLGVAMTLVLAGKGIDVTFIGDEAARSEISDKAKEEKLQDKISVVNGMEFISDVEVAFDFSPDGKNKKEMAGKIESCIPENAVLAIHTILSDVSRIAAGTKIRNRVIGARYVAPGSVKNHVEITRTLDTDDETYKIFRDFAGIISKDVVDAPDIVGGIYFRLMPVSANMAARLIMEGVAMDDIETAIIYGTNSQIGPLRVADYVGIDVVLELLEAIYAESGEATYRPCPLLKNMVQAGLTGVKAGRGFYTYK